jgi:hypothetical protein
MVRSTSSRSAGSSASRARENGHGPPPRAGAAPSISNRAKLVVHEVDPPLQLRDGLCLLKTPNEVVRDLVHLDKDSNFVPKSAFRRVL